MFVEVDKDRHRDDDRDARAGARRGRRQRRRRFRALGARSEWSPGVQAGGFSGAAVRDCSALTERDLNAITERDVRAGCRFLDRGTGRGPGALHTGCILCFLSIPACYRCGQCPPGRSGVAMVRRRSTVRFRKGARRQCCYFRNYCWSSLSRSWNESWRRSNAQNAQVAHC